MSARNVIFFMSPSDDDQLPPSNAPTAIKGTKIARPLNAGQAGYG
jgi:hypothetical protein